jgi:hypothetical protein
MQSLRYQYFYMEALHRFGNGMKDDSWFKKERPFVAQYVSTKKVTYDYPRAAPSFFGQNGPWTPTTGTQGLCNLALYTIADDEGSLGPMWLDSGFLSSPMDGLLVVHPMLWFSFAADITGPLARWKMIQEWAKEYFKLADMPHFCIDTPGAAVFKKVGIVFQPRFEYGPAPTIRSAGPPQVLEARTTATVDIRVRAASGAPTFTAGTPPTLNVCKDDLGRWIMRYLVRTQPAAIPGTLDNSALKATDLTPLATALGTVLGRAAGTVAPYS